jgi:hypothetical protein
MQDPVSLQTIKSTYLTSKFAWENHEAIVFAVVVNTIESSRLFFPTSALKTQKSVVHFGD